MDWPEARARLGAAPFAPLAEAIARLPADRWPGHADLDALAAGITTQDGQALRFVAPAGPGDGELPYELRIAASGAVPTRPRNWHDLFNALAWVAFPRTKARINARHAALLTERGEAETRRRGPERDALALFDEGGVIVACDDPALLALIAGREWKELFWRRRAEVIARMRFFAFGHALHEKMLEPYVGIVAKTVFVRVDRVFLRMAPPAQRAVVDARVATHLGDRERFASPRALPPLPVLGIPGWYGRNEDEAFYDDTRHFRPRPQRDAPGP